MVLYPASQLEERKFGRLAEMTSGAIQNKGVTMEP